MQHPKVLLVEDEPIIAQDLRIYLSEWGYQVLDTIATADKAVEQANTLKPNLIIMDIKLKGHSDGIDAAVRIHQSSNIPVVFLTAYLTDETIIRAKQASPWGYLLKPCEPSTLRATLEMALNGFRKESELLKDRDLLLALMETVPEFICFKDQEGRFIRINRTLAGFLDLENPDEARGKMNSDYFDPAYSGAVHEMEQAIMQTGKPVIAVTEDMIRRDGQSIRILSSRWLLKDALGKTVGTFWISKDINDRF
ncbi:response regulator [bacterium]|nr:response regulator [bacterium]